MLYTNVIFDLDDTLINTTDQLIPIAISVLRQVLISYEISISEHELIKIRQEFFKTNPRQSFNTHLVQQFFDLKEQSEVLNKLSECFYNIPLPNSLLLTPDAEKVLKELKANLYLVTSGSKVTQFKKIKLTGLEKYFKSWHCAEDEVSLSKHQLFKELIKDKDPKSVLVIGNRIDNEIKAANSLGVDSCLYLFGEYKALTPLSDLEKPTYSIQSLLQVREICST